MLIEHWDAFYEQAVALYRQNPLKTRFVTKYRHCDGKLWLKVTDDATVRRWGVAAPASGGRQLVRRASPLILLSSCCQSEHAVLAIQDRPADGPAED